jgi:crotonobetainyl-CoA:carnitine CoA-transferase CaiB-like acyl-CoA transferase
MLLPWFLERTRAEAFATLQQYSVMCAPIHTVDEVRHDPQIVERGYFAEVEHPLAGLQTLPGAPFQMSETPWSMRMPAPLLGQHNEEVYCGELGLDKSELVALARSGVV